MKCSTIGCIRDRKERSEVCGPCAYDRRMARIRAASGASNPSRPSRAKQALTATEVRILRRVAAKLQEARA